MTAFNNYLIHHCIFPGKLSFMHCSIFQYIQNLMLLGYIVTINRNEHPIFQTIRKQKASVHAEKRIHIDIIHLLMPLTPIDIVLLELL